ncbi:Pyruvate dehydrogenase E1 component [Novipirellula aureliae]|uniref:Pyruvate dehydrogenase E1 component n=1 Tax=Novipirellula aureliae TaxID=2527966 RepID=A0A5C6DTT3_9BACT|nr:pyruvate dehydrogenase (acetyl-transferring), homodimeric type [Novipirellula aureliae]TWU40090.1 Pyruvate dehydrogenase E1 component [Novipirellula aureliae]
MSIAYDLPTETRLDPAELNDWYESLDSVAARYDSICIPELLSALQSRAKSYGTEIPSLITTPYLNTIPADQQSVYPGNLQLEKRVRNLIRWNAMAMVVRANRYFHGIGGHLASYASSATLIEVGFNHFFRAPTEDHFGDFVYFQGHSSPGIYARAFLEGRLSESELDRFRRETPRETGLSSYPHPWLMPNFWQFPTVSMGLGPLMAIYQARFLKYLTHRGILDASQSRVWCFMGDGESDEPESLGALSVAAREQLDNLTFVVNCNLQRLDGPVRGNGKIIQELEGVFAGTGWNVIKAIWGSEWDELLAADRDGLLAKRMDEAVDGEYQKYKAESGRYIRDHFFGTSPELKAMVSHLSDDQLRRLRRGGHDSKKVYAAYKAATEYTGGPSVVLAKTVKGYGLGTAGEASNVAHQQHELKAEQLQAFGERFEIPLSQEELERAAFCKPDAQCEEIDYMMVRRSKLGGFLPARNTTPLSISIPSLDEFSKHLNGTGTRAAATTMILARILAQLLQDKRIGKYVVPIIPDEARTFGLNSLFASHGIYSSRGQLYAPVDAGQMMFYREARDGQILEEGITEAGSIASFIAAGTSYAHLKTPMIPFYLYYSMFGFQRIGDFIWAAADSRAKGFLVGATSGRTTLVGEGLQHCDGHSPLVATTIPTLQSYDPAYGYELAVIIQDGLQRMFVDNEAIFYYLTGYNEVYSMPAMPDGAEVGILKGMYRLPSRSPIQATGAVRPQLFGSGSLLPETLRAQEILAEKFGIESDVWSVTSYCRLRRDALAVDRDNALHPDRPKRQSYLEEMLDGMNGPIIAVTDYIKLVPDQIRQWVPGQYMTLGTDGFGRSDTREALRRHFEVDAEHIAYAALRALSKSSDFEPAKLSSAMDILNIDPQSMDPATA